MFRVLFGLAHEKYGFLKSLTWFYVRFPQTVPIIDFFLVKVVIGIEKVTELLDGDDLVSGKTPAKQKPLWLIR